MKFVFVVIGEFVCGGLGILKVIGGVVCGGKGVMDSGFIVIGNCCVVFWLFILWDCENVIDVGLVVIGKGCWLLEKLDFMKCLGVGD